MGSTSQFYPMAAVTTAKTPVALFFYGKYIANHPITDKLS